MKYYSGSLTITDNATNSPQVISLAGNGTATSGSGAGSVVYTPKVGGYYFNNQIVMTSSTPLPVTITNNQSVPLTFNSITSTADYPFTTNCGNGNGTGTLGAGASCTVQVSFDPQALGNRTANLTIAESAAGSPIVIPLQATGISGSQGPIVTVTPPAPCMLPSETQQFSSLVAGESNTAVSWYVDNVLNGNSTVGTISQSGSYTAPPYGGTHRIKAISQASSGVLGVAVANVTTSPTFEIYPYVTSIPTSAHRVFRRKSASCLTTERSSTRSTIFLEGTEP